VLSSGRSCGSSESTLSIAGILSIGAPMIEKDMEDLIASFPEDFFPRKHFVLVGRQQSFSGIGRFDLLFEDEFKSTILMELKARTLKYDDATQVARYRDELPLRTSI
jgi:RecB family endonuclease NucS